MIIAQWHDFFCSQMSFLSIRNIVIVAALIELCSSDSRVVTGKVFGDIAGLNGVVAAYGDINNDKVTDVFAITGDNRRNVSILLGGERNTISLSHSQTVYFQNQLTSVASADFNNDGYIDLMVTSKRGPDVIVSVVWGIEKGKVDPKQISTIATPLANQPLLLDADGDKIVDLFVTLPDKKRQFWISPAKPGKDLNFVNCDFHKPARTIEPVNSNAFLDLTGDGSTNLVVSSRQADSKVFEVWQGSDRGLILNETQTYIGKPSYKIGQSAFADIDGDGIVDHLMPVCETDSSGSCSKSKILMYQPKKKNWISLFETDQKWNFVHSDEFPISLVLCDYNEDVYMDVLCIMKLTADPVAVLLKGGKCNQAYCQDVGRMFIFSSTLPSSEGAILASFYDLADDGQMDILVSVQRGTSRKTLAYQYDHVEDVSFLIVKVLPSFQEDRFSNVHGACVSYITTNIEGGNQMQSACQLTRTTYFALQLPYVTFGLGRLPNYVDSISVALPTALVNQCGGKTVNTGFTPVKREWTMIIPNSQLFIKPYPTNDPDSWTSRMLVTPSKNVIATAAVLLSTCALVGVAIIILHCLERRDDMQEKIKDSQRFHFDAM